MTTAASFPLHRLADADADGGMAAEVRVGLTAAHRWLPPKFLYDARGSALFEQITEQPEYYLTRTETQIIADVIDDWIPRLRPAELVEIGSGSSRKTRTILEGMARHGTGDRYVAFDVSEDAVLGAASALTAAYDWLDVMGVVGDFDRHLPAIPRRGRGLVAFLGSTLGNLHPDGEQARFVADLAALVGEGDGLLLGLDLVKDPDILEAAYNDAAGVSADFARNVLHVVNRELGADFPAEEFGYRAAWDPEAEWIEMALITPRDLTVRVAALDLDVELAEGEEIRTEISCKFRPAKTEALLAGAGLTMMDWRTDDDGWFGLALATRA